MNQLKNVGLQQRVTLRRTVECAPNGNSKQYRAEDIPNIRASIGPAFGNQGLNLSKAPSKETTSLVVLRYFGPITEEGFIDVTDMDGPQKTRYVGGDVILSGSRKLYVTKVISVNEDAEETTVLCREHHG